MLVKKNHSSVTPVVLTENDVLKVLLFYFEGKCFQRKQRKKQGCVQSIHLRVSPYTQSPPMQSESETRPSMCACRLHGNGLDSHRDALHPEPELWRSGNLVGFSPELCRCRRMKRLMQHTYNRSIRINDALGSAGFKITSSLLKPAAPDGF